MAEFIRAPFNDEQVVALNKHQKAGYMHPFTCGSGNRTDANHLDNEGVLKATNEGLVCPYCDYKQNWPHAHMLLKPVNPFDNLSVKGKV